MTVKSDTPASRSADVSIGSKPVTETLWSIENLRTIAILGVVAFHAICFGNLAAHPRAPGLDIFFVISGFLVWHLTNQKGYKSLQFFAHRCSRIFPLYAIATCAMYILAKNIPFVDMFHHGSFGPMELLKSLFFIPYTATDGFRLPVLAPGWTLNYDMYFFGIFSIVLLFSKNRMAWCTILFMVPAVLHFFIRPPTSALTEMLVSTRSIAFLSGIFIAEILRKKYILPAVAAFWVATGACIFYLLLCFYQVDYWRWGVLLWMSAPIAGVYAMVSLEYRNITWMKLPWCEQIGRWSFSIYMIHIFIIPFTMSLPLPLAIDILVTLGASVFAGSLLNRYVERPMNRFAKRLEMNSRSRAGLARSSV